MALSKTERIRLIQSAAKALAKETEVDADLTLATFEVEEIGWLGSWSEDPYPYLIDRLKPVPDETLIDLNAHLSGDGAGEAAKAVTRVGKWRAGHRKVFLSHTTAHRKLAAEIRTRLLGEKVDVFVAHDNIETNEDWANEIRIHLTTCEFLVALFTEDFIRSPWCDQEVGFALGNGTDIIGIKCGADPHGFVYPKQGFEAHPDDPDAAVRIAKEVCRLVKGEEPSAILDPAAAAVRKYTRSHSFDQARENFGKLKRLKASEWTPALVELAREAGKNNGQIADAWWYDELVPDALVEHLEEIGVLPATANRPSAASAVGGNDIPF